MMESKKFSFQNLWLVSYADFMTILMIFFLCLYGYSSLAKAAAAKLRARTEITDFSAMVHGLKKNLGDKISIQESVNKITVQLPEEILFDSGRAVLKGNSGTISTLAESLKKTDGIIVVEGHTDNVPVGGGPFHSNWELSAARAFSVIEQLKVNGIPESRLSAWGFGEHRPVASNGDRAGRSKNRRIEVVVLKGANSASR